MLRGLLLSLTFSAKLVMAASPSVLKVTLARQHRSMKLATNSVAEGSLPLMANSLLRLHPCPYQRPQGAGELLLGIGNACVGLDEAIVGEEHVLVERCSCIG